MPETLLGLPASKREVREKPSFLMKGMAAKATPMEVKVRNNLLLIFCTMPFLRITALLPFKKIA